MDENLAQPFAETARGAAAAACPELVVAPRDAARILAPTILVLVGASVAATSTGVGDRMLGLDAERTLPTFFSTLILLIAAALLGVISAAHGRARGAFRHHWTALSLVFLYLAADEYMGLHEIAGGWLSAGLRPPGIFFYASTLVTLTLVAIFAVAFARFTLHLPPRFRLLFGQAALLYVGGALGVELLGSWHDQRVGADTGAYAALTTVEETLELCGVSLFIHALLDYLGTCLPATRLRFAAPPR